jgi:hypothetical protein
MSIQVQYRRGTNSENNTFTGALAEITVDTTNWVLRLHDGVTVGGAQTLIGNSAIQTLSNKTLAAPTITGNITGNVVPVANLVYSLGSPDKMWASVYVGGNTIYLGSLQLKDIGGNTFAVYTSDGTTQANIDVGNIDVSAITQGNTTIGISQANGNAYITVTGTSNVAVFTTTGLNITGTISANGNITGGNLLTDGLISATGNITGNYFLGNGSLLTGVAASYGNANVVANLAALGSNPVSTTGNVTGNYFLGNGSLLTGVAASYGNANVVANLAALGTNPVSTTGNITGGYFVGNGSQLTGIAASYSDANVATFLAAYGSNTISTTGNITAGNVLGGANVNAITHTGTTVSVTGNITAGNVLGGANVNATLFTGTTVSVTGNITSSYFIGNGSLLTGISGGGGAFAWAIANSNITMSANNGYFVDTTGGAKTMTLPASASIGDTIRINDLAGTFASNNLTVARNGGNIQGVAEDLVVSVNQSSFGLAYSNGTYGWKLLEL